MSFDDLEGDDTPDFVETLELGRLMSADEWLESVIDEDLDG